MTNQPESYNIQWVQEKPKTSSLLWPGEDAEESRLQWTDLRLKQELEQYKLYLEKQLSKIKTGSKSFESDVKSYQTYVESNLIDTKLIAEVLMDKRQKYPQETLDLMNQKGPVLYVRSLRKKLAKAIIEKQKKQEFQDICYTLPPELKVLWPNLQTIELAFQSILKNPAFTL